MRRDECTDQEKWVLEQLEQGKDANLKTRLGEDAEQRRLRSRFLEALLTDDIDGFKPHRRGIRIWHAVVTEPLDLENAEIRQIVFLIRCTFTADINFMDVRSHRVVSLNGSHFQGKADFHRFTAAAGLLCRQAVFQGPVDFGSADIGGQFNAEGAEFKGETGTASFNGLKVGQSAIFRRALFKGPVDFGAADINGQFNAEGAEFKGETGTASFNGLKVGQDAFFLGAVFQGPVDFGSADIGGQFNAKRAEFQSETETARFNGLKVGQSAIFDEAIFLGPVDFTGADIGLHFVGNKAKFQSKTAKASFNGLKVGQNIQFRGAIFHGPAVFDFLETKGSFYIDTKNGEQPTIFKGEATFGGANIGGQFLADRAIFSKDANFGGIIVKDRCIFNQSVFKTNAFLNYILIKDLNIIGEKPFINLNICHAKIKRELILSGLTLSKLEMWNAHCEGHADLNGLEIKESCSMQNSYFLSLTLREINWPPPEKTSLEGLTYKTISAGDRDEDWRKLLEWIKGARFNIQPYNQLEAYLRSCGHQDRADEVFIAGKRRAANQLIWWKRWSTKLFWGALTGYGRKPWQVLYVIVPLVVFGALLFPPEFTAKFTESHSWLKDMTARHPWIINFLLSLDRFLPGVDLGLAKEWSPSFTGINLFAFAYWYFLKLTGWITIPIALAAIYTRIK